jgi:hypothetical protein
MTTVTGPVTGPPRAPARLTMTPGRWITLLIGVPVALVLMGFSALSLVSDIGMARFPVSRTIPLDHGRLVASVDGGDFTVQQGQASGAAQLTGTVQYSLIRPDFSVDNGTGINLHCRLLLGNCGLNATLTVPPRTALDLTTGGGNMRLSDVRSAVTLASDGGDISLSGADVATVTTSGGNLSTTADSGKLTFHTAGGDVDGSALLAPDVTVGSGGGDVTLTFTTVPAFIDVESSGGDVSIVLPHSATEYAIKVNAGGGDYTPHVADNDAAADRITVTSGGGDVSITKAH